jgi:predicted acylesterase/phospholipase RssA
VRFGKDKDTLDFKVSDAISASSSIPFLNPPTEVRGNLYIDGAFAEYCPFGTFEDVKDKSSVIGLCIDLPQGAESDRIDDFGGYVTSLCDLLIKRLNSGEEAWFAERRRNVGMKKDVARDLLGAPTHKQADELFDTGYDLMEEFYQADLKKRGNVVGTSGL